MKLSEARQKAGLNREVAAVRIGVATSTLRAWEKGINTIPSSALQKIQEVLGLSDADILSIIKNPQKEAS